MHSECIFDVLYTDARAADQNAYDVESVVLAGQSMAVDPDLSGPAKLALLVPIDGFDWITELDPCPGLDLYERDQAASLRDYIDVAMTASETAFADPPAFMRQPLRGDALAQRSQRLLGVLHARSVRVLPGPIVTTPLRA